MTVNKRAHAARAAIGEIEPGIDIIVSTEGRFDFADAIELVAEAVGAVSIDVIVWTANSEHVRRVAALAPLRLVIDPGFFLCRPPEEVAAMREAAPALRTADTHVKAAIIRGRETWTIQTSANLNINRRSELIEISDDPVAAAAIGGMIDAIFTAPLADNPDATGLAHYHPHIPWMERAGMVTI